MLGLHIHSEKPVPGSSRCLASQATDVLSVGMPAEAIDTDVFIFIGALALYFRAGLVPR